MKHRVINVFILVIFFLLKFNASAALDQSNVSNVTDLVLDGQTELNFTLTREITNIFESNNNESNKEQETLDSLMSHIQLLTSVKKIALLSYIGQVHKGVRGVIKDSSSKSPISEAIIQVDGISKNVSSYIHGDYWRLLTPGHYVLRASHPDYMSQSTEIEVKTGAAVVVNFQLDPKGPNFKEILSRFVIFMYTNPYVQFLACFLLLAFTSMLLLIAFYLRIRNTGEARKGSDKDIKLNHLVLS